MVEITNSLIGDPPADNRPPTPASSGRVLWHLIWLYVEASAAAVVIVLTLVLLGLEMNLKQWIMLLYMVPLAVSIYVGPDIYIIVRHYRPLGSVLRQLDRREKPNEDDVATALVQALNLPFYAFIRVTFVHGPLAAIAVLFVLYVLNFVMQTGFQNWQILSFAATVFFFASPTHAIFEYFAISRYIIPIVERLWPYCGTLDSKHQGKLIAIRLKSKLLYLAIFVTSLPLLFLASSIIFKVDLLLANLAIDATREHMMPLWLWIIGVVAVCMIGALVMSILTASEVSRSAASLVEAMNRVEEGKLDVHLNITGTDEYGDLFRGFNLMTEGLRDEVRILEVTHDLSGELQLDVLLSRIMSATTELLDANRSTLFIHDRKTNELWSRYAEGLEIKEIRFPDGEGIAGAVFASGQAESISDAYGDARFNPDIDSQTGYRTENILCMPIVNKAGESIGVTQVLNKRTGSFTTKDESRLRAFTAQVAVSLENAKLFDDVLSMKNFNESIVQSTSNGMVTLDTDRNITTTNEAARKILGIASDDIVERQASDLFHEGNGWVIDSLAKVERLGQADISVDADLKLGSGDTASVNLTVVPLIDAADENIGSMLILEDITSEKRVKTTMARYMSKEVADQLIESGEAVLGGKDQKVSILFSDVRNFTTISEALGARQTVSMLNDYFEEMVEVIFHHGGILDKYISDAIMALFGAPFNGPQDADNAIAVANGMIVSLRELNRRRTIQNKDVIDIGVGISTGDVIAGTIGSPKRMEYTVIGDSVNLASRLEGANKYYGTKILVSEHTVRNMKTDALMREIDFMRVKGKDEPVGVYEILGFHTEDTFPNMSRTLAAFEDGFASYRARDWRRAADGFEAALDAHAGDQPSRIYLERTRHYLADPPGNEWDGVWVMTEK